MRGPTREQRAANKRASGTVRYQRSTPGGPVPSRAVRLCGLSERGVDPFIPDTHVTLFSNFTGESDALEGVSHLATRSRSITGSSCSLRAAVDKIGTELFTPVQSPPGDGQLVFEKIGSSGWTRTNNPPVNSCGGLIRTTCHRVR